MRADNRRAMVDTNVVIYAYDPTDPSKHEIARQLLENLSDSYQLVYSAQIFNEFCSVMLRQSRVVRLTPAQARRIVDDLRATGFVVPVTDKFTLRALDAVIAHRLSFWDALLWAAAKENSVTEIYTEDLPGAPEIEGVRYINPFDSGA